MYFVSGMQDWFDIPKSTSKIHYTISKKHMVIFIGVFWNISNTYF